MTERLRRIPADWQLDLAMVRERITQLEELATMFADTLEHLDAKRSVDLNACHPILRCIHDWGPNSGPYVRQVNDIFVLLREANPKGLDAFTKEFLNDIEGYDSKEGELFLIPYLLLKGIEIVEIYPTTREKKSDLLVRLDGEDCFVEVFTPREKHSLFARRVNDYLVDRLRRLRTGFKINVDGIDQSYIQFRGGHLRFLEHLSEPSQQVLDKIVRNIRRSFQEDDWQPGTERHFWFCEGVGLSVKLLESVRGLQHTAVLWGYGISGIPLDPARIADLVRKESRHFAAETSNVVFVNLTKGLHHYADGYYFDKICGMLNATPPSRIDLIFTFRISNRPDQLLDFRRLLFSNGARRFPDKKAALKLVNAWMNDGISAQSISKEVQTVRY